MKRIAVMVIAAAVAAHGATNAPPGPAKSPTVEIAVAPGPAKPARSLQQKMTALVLPEMAFRSAPVPEILQWIMDRSAEVDPEKTGVNIIVKDDAQQSIGKHRLTLNLKAPTVDQALKLLATTAGLYIRVDERAVVVERSAHYVP